MSDRATGASQSRTVSLPEPDPHGQAALLLAESMLHGLIERAVITTADAVEIVAIAAEVKAEVGDAALESERVVAKSLQLLTAIRQSIELDMEGSAPAAGAG